MGHSGYFLSYLRDSRSRPSSCSQRSTARTLLSFVDEHGPSFATMLGLCGCIFIWSLPLKFLWVLGIGYLLMVSLFAGKVSPAFLGNATKESHL